MKNNIWQLLPGVDRDFIDKNPGYEQVILQLLFNRGITTKNEIEDFLGATYERNILDPFLFQDMEAAVDLIIKHIKAGNKIFVYGDYDADGVTSSALLKDILEMLRGDISVYLPDRVSEGYGLNQKAIEYIVEQNAKLIITVDGGIRNKAEVAYARDRGVDVIVTDHHPAPEEKEDWPDCLIVNATLPGEKYPFKYLAGVGVAFKLAKAIISKSKLSDEHKRMLEERILDLVAIGTVADCVNLIGENRVLTKKGLELLSQTRRLGLLELFDVSGIDTKNEIKSWNVGFQIGPRINAAGRIDHANTAFELLVSKDKAEARRLAASLNSRNTERQQITSEIFAEVEKQINKDDNIIIGVCEDDIWNEGVVGLVAGKVCEKYYKPTLVITKTDEGYKGSGRSIEDFNLAQAIEECSEYLDKYGGHPLACGFSFFEENLDGFRNKLHEIANKKLGGVDLRPKIRIDVEVDLRKINEEFVTKIGQFEPFGQGNPQPRFLSPGLTIVDILYMGAEGQHIKLKVKNESSNVVSAIGFGQSERWQDLKIGDIVDIVYYLNVNEFNGRREVQLMIVDMKLTVNA